MPLVQPQTDSMLVLMLGETGGGTHPRTEDVCYALSGELRVFCIVIPAFWQTGHDQHD